jgi:hypothetical protein
LQPSHKFLRRYLPLLQKAHNCLRVANNIYNADRYNLFPYRHLHRHLPPPHPLPGGGGGFETFTILIGLHEAHVIDTRVGVANNIKHLPQTMLRIQTILAWTRIRFPLTYRSGSVSRSYYTKLKDPAKFYQYITDVRAGIEFLYRLRSYF